MINDDLIARLGIQDLHARYTDAFFRKDEAALRECWVADGEWFAFGRKTKGRESIITFWQGLMKDRHNIWHAPQASIVRVDGSTAEGRVYVSESVTSTGGTARVVLGIYQDQYRIEDEEWRFARRWWNLVYLGPPDFSGRYWDVPEMGAPPGFDGWEQPNRPTLEDVATYVRTLGA